MQRLAMHRAAAVVRSLFLLIAGALLVACGSGDSVEPSAPTPDVPTASDSVSVIPKPPPGSNEMLREALALADSLEVIVSDVVIPPNATVPRHYHPGQEFIYVLEGSAIHVEEGQPDRVLRAGDTYVIPPRAVHAPRGGPDGARAVVFRVHAPGLPERTLVSDDSL